jgi:vitamin B12 transporter
MAAAGRYGTRQWSLGGGHDFGNDSRLGFNVGRLESDGFAPLLSSTEARGFANTTANLHGRFAASKRLTLRAQAWRASGRAEYLDFFASPLAQDFENSAYDLAADFRASDRWQARFGLSAALDETAQIESDDFVRTRRRGVDLQSDWQLSEHVQLTTGALLTRETIDAQVFGTPIDADVNVEQVFGELQYVRGRQRWSGTAAYVDHPSFGGHGVWNAEYVLGFGSGSRLLLAAGSAFHAPDASERFGFGGNPQLEPERSRQVEVGLRQQLGARHEWQLAAYRNEISDLINYVITDFVTFDGRNENVDRALIEGVELTYRYRGENWSLRAGASFNNPRDRGTDSRLLRRAREQFLLAAVKRWSRWEISADAQWQGERLDFGFPSPTVLGSYTLLNLGASFAVTNDWSLQLKLDNALDERYELVSGYRTARRSLTLATRYRFR